MDERPADAFDWAYRRGVYGTTTCRDAAEAVSGLHERLSVLVSV
jgi:hypothetical protein